MDKMPAMLEMRVDLLQMFKITERDWFCLLMPLKRLVIQERYIILNFPLCFGMPLKGLVIRQNLF